tara:strand:- start:195 stop:422 length:228 start_codon:yes stop_codon:yes gene_type:complete
MFYPNAIASDIASPAAIDEAVAESTKLVIVLLPNVIDVFTIIPFFTTKSFCVAVGIGSLSPMFYYIYINLTFNLL